MNRVPNKRNKRKQSTIFKFEIAFLMAQYSILL